MPGGRCQHVVFVRSYSSDANRDELGRRNTQSVGRGRGRGRSATGHVTDAVGDGAMAGGVGRGRGRGRGMGMGRGRGRGGGKVTHSGSRSRSRGRAKGRPEGADRPAPIWAQDADESIPGPVATPAAADSVPIEDIRKLMWGHPGDTTSQKGGITKPKPRMAPADTKRGSSIAKSALVVAAVQRPADAGEWSPVAALLQEQVATAELSDAEHGPKLTFEEFESKNSEYAVAKEIFAKDATHIGDTFDLQTMKVRYHLNGGVQGKKSLQLCRGMVTVQDARRLFGREEPASRVPLPLEAQVAAARSHAAQLREAMPSRVYRNEPFSVNTAAIASVQKNWSLAVHGVADSMVQELRAVQAANDQWAATRRAAWTEELERQASQVVEEVVVEEEKVLAYGQVLEWDDDDGDDEF